MLVECIAQLLKKEQGPVRILACAPSNSAADLLAQRLAVTMDPSDMYRLNAVSRDFNTIPESLRRFCSFDAADAEQCVLLPRSDILRRQLVVATCISAATLYSLGCEVGDFTHIIMDEAGHATEPEALAAMCGLIDANRTRIVLGGDPQQLGPIVRSPLAVQYGLGMSLLERLLVDHATNKQSPYHRDPQHPFPWRYITKLLFNYRSHPAILEVPNAAFYQNELIASADRLSRESLQRWPVFPAPAFPILFHHLVGEEGREADSPSWWNGLEAQTAVEYVCQLLAYRAGAVGPADIGIITPYRKQVQKIRQLLKYKLASTSHDERLLKVGSVEEFQGQERRVIVISTVRSQLINLEQFDVRFKLGFVGHPKRLNVALTRAKCAMVIVGNALLLRTDPHWKRYIDFLHAHGAVLGGYRPERAPAPAALPTGNADLEALQRLLLQYSAEHGGELTDAAVKDEEKEEGDNDSSELIVHEEPAWRREE